MSGRSDLRMYVEHLFEGRTLDAETIELKEEIYGNLVARFDDYVGQGMSEEEAYRRTCDAVSSVEDVLGEKDSAAETEADATVVAPAAAVASDSGDKGNVPPTPVAATPKRRWPIGAIVAAVAGVVLVGIALLVAWGAINVPVAQDVYDDATSATVQQIEGDGTSEYQDDTGTDPTNQTTTGNGNGYGAQGATGLDAEVYAHSVDELAAYADMSVSSEPFLAMMKSLPLGFYAHQAMSEPDTGTIELTYTYDDRDALARDDDCVDRALVYDVVAAMSVTSDLQTLRIVEEETDDDGELDRDVHVFDRTTVEGILGFPLNADLLTSDTWDATRNEVMTTRAWDAIWESSDVD